MRGRREHWERVYREREPGAVSWYAPTLETSLRLIREVAPPTSAVIDVGGGASTLVDDLLSLGYADVTVCDISEAALELARARLGSRAESVNWIRADVTEGGLPRDRYDLWHDRAVFHFLTDDGDRRAYVEALRGALKPGGFAVFATFAPDGPERCSGLPVVRYDHAALAAELGEDFRDSASGSDLHTTPGGKTQAFSVHRFQRRA